MASIKITAANTIKIESSINNKEKSFCATNCPYLYGEVPVAVAQCMTDASKYFIFRDSGIEVVVIVHNAKITRFTKPLLDKEEVFFKKFILIKNEE